MSIFRHLGRRHYDYDTSLRIGDRVDDGGRRGVIVAHSDSGPGKGFRVKYEDGSTESVGAESLKKVDGKRGKKFTFHGNFKSKADATAKEREVHGFIIERKGRYVVMTENK